MKLLMNAHLFKLFQSFVTNSITSLFQQGQQNKESPTAGHSGNALGYRREENSRKALSLGSSTIPIKQNSFEIRNIHNKFHGNNQKTIKKKKKTVQQNYNNGPQVRRIQ